jgi:hypothetical protein
MSTAFAAFNHRTREQIDSDSIPRIRSHARQDTQAYSAMTRNTHPELAECVERIRSHPMVRYVTYQVLFDRIYTEVKATVGTDSQRKEWSYPELVHTARLQTTDYLLVILDDMSLLLSKISN